MGVYIKGIKKPDRCEACYCHIRDNRHFDVICDLLHRTVAINDCNYEEPTIPPKDCPLVEVAEPHGRLVDVNTAYQDTMIFGEKFRKSVLKIIDDLDTVIESEE